MKFTVVGSALTAYVNDAMMDQVIDTNLTAGGVGLIVTNATASSTTSS